MTVLEFLLLLAYAAGNTDPTWIGAALFVLVFGGMAGLAVVALTNRAVFLGVAAFVVVILLATAAGAQEGARIGGPAGRVLDRAGVKPVGAASVPDAPARSGGLFEAIEQITADDLRAAIALADLPTGPGGVADETAKVCYTAMLNYIELKQKFRAEQAAEERLFAKFQRTRNLVRMLDTDSPIRRACAALAADVKQDVRGLIGGLATGAILKALTIP